jgi:hypothetical protein
MEKDTREERALDALLIGTLRQIEAEPSALDAGDLPELAESEKAAMNALDNDFVQRLLAENHLPISVPVQTVTVRERAWLPWAAGVCGALAAALLLAIIALSGRDHRNADPPAPSEFVEQTPQVADELASPDVVPRARLVFNGPEKTTFSWPLEDRSPLASSSIHLNLPN